MPHTNLRRVNQAVVAIVTHGVLKYQAEQAQLVEKKYGTVPPDASAEALEAARTKGETQLGQPAQ